MLFAMVNKMLKGGGWKGGDEYVSLVLLDPSLILLWFLII